MNHSRAAVTFRLVSTRSGCYGLYKRNVTGHHIETSYIFAPRHKIAFEVYVVSFEIFKRFYPLHAYPKNV